MFPRSAQLRTGRRRWASYVCVQLLTVSSCRLSVLRPPRDIGRGGGEGASRQETLCFLVHLVQMLDTALRHCFASRGLFPTDLPLPRPSHTAFHSKGSPCSGRTDVNELYGNVQQQCLTVLSARSSGTRTAIL